MPKPKQSQNFVWVLLHFARERDSKLLPDTFGGVSRTKISTTDTARVTREIPSLRPLKTPLFRWYFLKLKKLIAVLN